MLPELFFYNQTQVTMIQKTYFKTKDYCKVKFSFATENAETVEVLGLNSDWENGVLLKKKKDGKKEIELDPKFYQALEYGLPPSAGIAVGLERLYMALTNTQKIQDLKKVF